VKRERCRVCVNLRDEETNRNKNDEGNQNPRHAPATVLCDVVFFKYSVITPQQAQWTSSVISYSVDITRPSPLSRHYNCVTSGTNVPPVVASVPLALAICPSFPDNIYGETYGKVQ